jgi:hypothetical protein
MGRVRLCAGLVPALLAFCGMCGVLAAAENENALRDVAALLRNMDPSDDYATVPTAATVLLPEFKSRLASAILEQLPEASPAELDLPLLQDRLTALARRFRPPEHEAEDTTSLYGYVLNVRAIRFPLSPAILGITFSVRIPCGEDTGALLVRRSGGRWEIDFTLDSGPYKSIDSAFGRLQVGVTSPAEDGSYYFVVANVNPWCTSNWQALRYSVHRLKAGRAPEEILASQEIIYIGRDEPVYDLRVEKSRFSLSFAASDDGDPGGTVERTVAYSLAGKAVQQLR